MSTTSEFTCCTSQLSTLVSKSKPASSAGSIKESDPILFVKSGTPLPLDYDDDVSLPPEYLSGVPPRMQMSGRAQTSTPGWPRRGGPFTEVDYGGGQLIESGKTAQDCVEIARMFGIPFVGYRDRSHPDPVYKGTCFKPDNVEAAIRFSESYGDTTDSVNSMFRVTAAPLPSTV